MKRHLAKFENEAAYDEFKAGENYVEPNVSWCVEEDKVKWNPYVIPPETRVVAKYNVTNTNGITRLFHSNLVKRVSIMEIDGVDIGTPVTGYTFETTGEHIIKLTIPEQNLNGVSFLFSGATTLVSIMIPDNIMYYGGESFSYCNNLSSVILGSGSTAIGTKCFSGCESLSSITMTNSIKTIGDYAFNSCTSLSSITIPDGVTSIGEYAFRGCTSLSSTITIPDGVTSIRDYAFRSCASLPSITIPDSVTSIGNYALENCRSLSSVAYNGTQAQWAAITKGYRWNNGMLATVVHCTDGDVSL